MFAGEIGMLMAIVGTLLGHQILNWQWVLAAFLIGFPTFAPRALGIRHADKIFILNSANDLKPNQIPH